MELSKKDGKVTFSSILNVMKQVITRDLSVTGNTELNNTTISGDLKVSGKIYELNKEPNTVYLGDKNVDGSWRIYVDESMDLHIQKNEDNEWVSKQIMS